MWGIYLYALSYPNILEKNRKFNKSRSRKMSFKNNNSRFGLSIHIMKFVVYAFRFQCFADKFQPWSSSILGGFDEECLIPYSKCKEASEHPWKYTSCLIIDSESVPFSFIKALDRIEEKWKNKQNTHKK